MGNYTKKVQEIVEAESEQDKAKGGLLSFTVNGR